MNNIQIYFLLIVLFFLGHSPCFSQNTMDMRPNVILIITDDMGYSDIGCYGGEIATPNIDKLGMNGLRYTQFYNMNHCAPSRASLMTGLYPHQTGLGWMPDVDFNLPGYRGEIGHNTVTIAEVLRKSGYATYMSGKWHLARNIREGGPIDNWPLQRGFDKFYGILTGAGNYYDPATLCRGNQLITPANDPEYRPENFYFTDAITDNSIQFIKDRDKDKPFFMYVAYTTAHWPMQAPEDEIEKYKGKYDIGWDVLRKQRFEREKELGVIEKNAILSPLDTHSWVEEEDKPAMARRMETYAAMISIMDRGIGEIENELREEGIFDNTIIIYLHDNGGNAENVGWGGPNGETQYVAKDTTNLRALDKDEIQYAVRPAITRNGAIAIEGKKVMAGPEDTYLAYLKPWGNLSNTPFRKYKNFVHEGGISTPLIIHWPKGITEEKGAIRKHVSHEIDIMPTIVELTKSEYPEVFEKHNITPKQGVSLVPTFKDEALEKRAIYWEHQGNKAMRMGDWKIVSGGELINGEYGHWKNFKSHPWELYNIKKDRSELTDLSGQYPELTQKMITMWEKWAHETQVYPMPWQEKKPPIKSYYLSTPWAFPNL